MVLELGGGREGASLRQEEEKFLLGTGQNARAEGNILEEDWPKEAPEKDTLTESWSTTLFGLSISLPTVANC